jgi:hypothetical protein
MENKVNKYFANKIKTRKLDLCLLADVMEKTCLHTVDRL